MGVIGGDADASGSGSEYLTTEGYQITKCAYDVLLAQRSDHERPPLVDTSMVFLPRLMRSNSP